MKREVSISWIKDMLTSLVYISFTPALLTSLHVQRMRFRRMYSREVDKTTGIKCDQIGMLETYKSLKAYPDKLRRVKYYDEKLDREFMFITNNMKLSAEEIALLYKNRWQVKLFFKWIKQHLRVESFWGTTMNAVKAQVYCAIITYCLVAISLTN